MVPGISARMEELAAGRVPFVHAVVVRAQFPTSVRAGDDAIVLPDGSIEGFVGGQCAENSVRTAALGSLRDGQAVLLRVLPEEERSFPDSPGAQVVVNPCLSGGALEIFLQPLLPPPVIWIVGESPIAQAVAELARPLDFVIRPAAHEQGPHGATAVVIASHGRGEIAAIRAGLDAGAHFIGLVASRRRGAAVLAEMGLSEAERQVIHSPVGIDIGARTPPEIALSILAEIVAAVRSLERAVPSPEPAVPFPEPAVLSAEPAVPSPEPAVRSPEPAPVVCAPGLQVLDPVCGMTVTVSPDTPHLSVDGEDFWFCSLSCRERHALKGER